MKSLISQVYELTNLAILTPQISREYSVGQLFRNKIL